MISATTIARQSLLLTLCVGAIGVLGNALVSDPKLKGLPEPAAFNFPPHVPLADTQIDRKSTRLNSSHRNTSRMPSSA